MGPSVMQNRLSAQARGHIAMLSFSALVAGSFSLGGLVANEIAPAALNAVRFAIAAVVMGALGFASGTIDKRLLASPWRFLVLGSLYAIYFVTMFEGLKTATPVSTAAVFTLAPLIAALVGWLLLRQVTNKRMALALLIGAVGAIWVIFRADLDALASFRVGRGELIFFWGVVAHAVFIPVSRMLNRGEHPILMTFGLLLSGFAILTLFGWRDIQATDWANLRPLVWMTIGYTALFAGATTFLLVQYATLRLPSAKVMAYTYLTPTWVILWEIALGHGAPSVLVLAGVALTIIALLMLLRDDG